MNLYLHDKIQQELRRTALCDRQEARLAARLMHPNGTIVQHAIARLGRNVSALGARMERASPGEQLHAIQ